MWESIIENNNRPTTPGPPAPRRPLHAVNACMTVVTKKHRRVVRNIVEGLQRPPFSVDPRHFPGFSRASLALFPAAARHLSVRCRLVAHVKLLSVLYFLLNCKGLYHVFLVFGVKKKTMNRRAQRRRTVRRAANRSNRAVVYSVHIGAQRYSGPVWSCNSEHGRTHACVRTCFQRKVNNLQTELTALQAPGPF